MPTSSSNARTLAFRPKLMMALAAGVVAVGAPAVSSGCVEIPNVTAEPGDASLPEVGADVPEEGKLDAPPDIVVPVADATPDALDGAASDADAGPPCTSTTTDPENCGRCGHSCLGGQCTQGVCQAFALYKNRGRPWGVAVDNEFVYWTDFAGGGIYRASKLPSPNPVVLTIAASSAQGVSRPWPIVVDDDHVYWGNFQSNGSVRRCPKTGCAGVAPIVAAASSPTSLFLDGPRIYWTDTGNRTIAYADKVGGGSATTAVPGLSWPQTVAVDDTYLYFTDFNDDLVGRAPKAGLTQGTPFTTLASGQGNAHALALSGSTVIWSTKNEPGSIRSAPKTGLDGGVPTTLATTQYNPYAMVVDAVDAYWLNQGFGTPFNGNPLEIEYLTGSLVACDLPSCGRGSRVLADGLPDVRSLAQDERAVYFSSSGTSTALGSLMMIAK